MSTPVELLMAKLIKLFDDFTLEKADAAKPIFEEALNRYSAETIAAGARDVLTGWRKARAPQAADFAEACTRHHAPAPALPASADHCELCKGEGYVVAGRYAMLYGCFARAMVWCPHDRTELEAKASRFGLRVPVLGDVEPVDERRVMA